jgi:hypothetical protein
MDCFSLKTDALKRAPAKRLYISTLFGCAATNDQIMVRQGHCTLVLEDRPRFGYVGVELFDNRLIVLFDYAAF